MLAQNDMSQAQMPEMIAFYVAAGLIGKEIQFKCYSIILEQITEPNLQNRFRTVNRALFTQETLEQMYHYLTM